MLKAGGIDEIAGHHGVAGKSLHREAVPGQHQQIVFGVVAAFFDGRIGEKGTEVIPDHFQCQRRRYGCEVGRRFDRKIKGDPLLPGQ